MREESGSISALEEAEAELLEVTDLGVWRVIDEFLVGD